MAPRVPKFQIIPNQELLRVGRIFKPEYGNSADLNLFNRVMSYEKLLRSIDNKILRGDPKYHTKKMKDLLSMENSLIREITSRNMDF